MAHIETCASAPVAPEDAQAARRAPAGFRRMTHALMKGVQRPWLDKDREIALIARAQAGDVEAVETLVFSHKAYLAAATRSHARRAELSIEASDLISAALQGFLAAIQNYRAEHGARLATFADYHVTGAVKQHILDFSAPVRIATNTDERRAWSQFSQMRRAFRDAYGREMQESLHDAELAVMFSTPNDKGEHVRPKALLNLMGAMRQRYSVSLDDVQVFSSETPNQSEALVVMTELRALLNTHIEALRKTLKPRDLKIVSYILEDLEDETARRAEMARRYGMTMERVGQIYRAALTDIRASLRKVGIKNSADAI